MESEIKEENKDDKNKNDIKKDNNNFLNKKTKRFKKHKKIKKFKKNNTIRQLEPIEQLYQKAKNIYEAKTSSYDLDKIDFNLKVNKEKKWTHDILQKGTFSDKISALLLYIRDNPKMTLKYLDILIRLSENKNRRKNDAIILGLKDLFLESILENKKYLPFNNKYKNEINNKIIDEEELFNSYYEDKVHHLYLRYVNLLEESINNENIINIKKKNMDCLCEMLIKKPESEEKILQVLVNKLGDTSNEISNYAIKLLNQIQEIHMNMSNIIFKYVTIFYSMNEKKEAKLNALNYLVQMEIPNVTNFSYKKIFFEESINFFFGLFNQISKENEENNNVENEKKLKLEKKKKKIKKLKKIILENKTNDVINDKFLSLIVKRINILFKYIKNLKNPMEKINQLIESKISVLFKLSHSKSLKLSIEILRLLFGIITTQDQNFISRYYKSLYELISSQSLSSSKHVKEALKLILISLMFDNNHNRICSFFKRLLEMCLISEPPYIICILIIISQVMRNKNKLWKMMEREQKGVKLFYDSTKRDPQFAQGEYSFLNELFLLEKHYHPSVQRMAKFIIENYNKDIISYNGNPLVDFSLFNFLEKFMLKNPKIKKEKKEIKVIEKDDDEFKRFVKGEENNNNNENNNINDIKDENDFEFIDKFNKIYPEITSDKNYLKKIKKKEKKMKTEQDVDNMIGEEEYGQKNDELELEQYADKVIDDEYKKYGKDIDDDLGEEDSENDENNDDNNNNDDNEEVDDLFTEDENENENVNESEELELDESEEEDFNDKDNNDNKNNNNHKKNKNKKEKDSGFVDAETYYKSLKNKGKKKFKK